MNDDNEILEQICKDYILEQIKKENEVKEYINQSNSDKENS